MRLVTVHKIMITFAVAMCCIFAIWNVHEYATRSSHSALALGPLSLAVGVALVLYLRYFIRRQARFRRDSDTTAKTAEGPSES